MANADGSDIEQALPNLTPNDDPATIKNFRTTAKTGHTKLAGKIRGLIAAGRRWDDIQPLADRLEEQLKTAKNLNAVLIAASVQHHCSQGQIDAHKDWETEVEKNHQDVLRDLDHYKQAIHTASQVNQLSLSLASSVTSAAAPSVATGLFSATHLPLNFGMAGPSSTMPIPVTTVPASLISTRPALMAPTGLGVPPQPIITTGAINKPFHGFLAGSVAPPAPLPSVTSTPAPAPMPSVTSAPVSFFAPWLPANTSTTTAPPIMTTTNVYPQLTGLTPASTTSFVLPPHLHHQQSLPVWPAPISQLGTVTTATLSLHTATTSVVHPSGTSSAGTLGTGQGPFGHAPAGTAPLFQPSVSVASSFAHPHPGSSQSSVSLVHQSNPNISLVNAAGNQNPFSHPSFGHTSISGISTVQSAQLLSNSNQLPQGPPAHGYTASIGAALSHPAPASVGYAPIGSVPSVQPSVTSSYVTGPSVQGHQFQGYAPSASALPYTAVPTAQLVSIDPSQSLPAFGHASSSAGPVAQFMGSTAQKFAAPPLHGHTGQGYAPSASAPSYHHPAQSSAYGGGVTPAAQPFFGNASTGIAPPQPSVHVGSYGSGMHGQIHGYVDPHQGPMAAQSNPFQSQSGYVPAAPSSSSFFQPSSGCQFGSQYGPGPVHQPFQHTYNGAMVPFSTNQQPWFQGGYGHQYGPTFHDAGQIGSVISRLANVQLEPFDGDAKSWPLFISNFKTLVHDQLPTDALRQVVLRSLLKPKVRNAVAELLYDPALYNPCLHRLQEEFGQEYVVAEAQIDKILSLPTIKERDPASLKYFSNELHGAVVALVHSGQGQELKSSATMKLLLTKFPSSLRTKWGMYAYDSRPKILDVWELDSWLRRISKSYDYASVITGSSAAPAPSKPSIHPGGKKGGMKTPPPSTIMLIGDEDSEEEEKTSADRRSSKREESRPGYCCFACKISPPHRIDDCKVFLDLTPALRVQLIKKEDRCLRCCVGRHYTRRCTSKVTCSVEDCGRRHHTLLHGAEKDVKKDDSRKKKEEPDGSMNAIISERQSCTTLLQLVPVTVRAKNGKSEDVVAFLDGGSTGTLISEDLAILLGLNIGERISRRFKTFDGRIVTIIGYMVDFIVEAQDGSFSLPICGAMTAPAVDVTQPAVQWPAVKARYPHLQDLELPQVDVSQIKILIGGDNIRAHDRLEVRYCEDPPTGPVAIRTPFGWVVAGPVLTAAIRPVGVHSINYINITDLHASVERFWLTDTLGTNPPEVPIRSKEDERAVAIMKSTVRMVDGHFVIGFPWKKNRPAMPDNKDLVLKRFWSLERRFKREPNFAADYVKIMEEYIRLGHARLTTVEELEGSPPWSNYVPHHGVYHPRKPDKLRVVFDLAAEFHGVSLNKSLLRGPDFLTSLLGVLLRFRVRPVALISDIEKMFHQVKVPVEEQAALRFFWRTPGVRLPPRTYQMTVHVFGAVSSPSVCAFALRKTAEDHHQQFPAASEMIIKNFYVDNYLGSLETEEEAVEAAKQLTTVTKLGGFRLTKWLSSSRKVMGAIDVAERAEPTMDLSLDPLPIDRTLGVLYSSEEDTFFFRPEMTANPKTHRAVLSAVSTIFDPLGILSPVVITAKCLLQDICRLRVGWDAPLPPYLLARWHEWADGLQSLQDLRIRRCLRRNGPAPLHQSVHVFSDASEIAFGAVIQIRSEYSDGSCEVAFVIAKTRVAPLKQLSIPRLELQGVLTGYRLVMTVLEELELPVEEVTFWTDSTTVLKWINGSCKFRAFVAHRIGEILSNTERKQWRHVPGHLNPADDCSRGIKAEELNSEHRFFTGTFLKTKPEEWPGPWILEEVDEEDPEVVPTHAVNSLIAFPDRINVLMGRITWLPVVRLSLLQRYVAQVQRFPFNIRAKKKKEPKRSGPFTAEELQQALYVCVRTAQATYFDEELRQLSKGKPVDKGSSLRKLSPFLDPDGIIRVGGRLDRLLAAPDVKHPIVLPPQHRLTELIIWHFHLRGQLPGSHVRPERLLADLRAVYWIPAGRRTVQKVLNSCFTCKRLHAKTVAPIMAPLPAHRLGPTTFPFVNTGVDYCGPFYIVVGRQSHKKWICLFTCLVTRSVHLELASSLDTDSFLLAFQRFIDVRGAPTNVYSDNGTNFKAGRRELEEGADRIDYEKVHQDLAARRIHWSFSPPLSPHFGGAWERIVRSAKSAMKAVFGQRSVNEEVFRTVMSGVAALLNARPLTHVGVSPDDPEPITPNHFLLGRAHPHIPLDKVPENDVISRRRFRAAQALLDMYWQRWMREYVPSLTERKKWMFNQQQIKLGDFVICVDSNNPRGQWPLARVIQLIPGEDKVVRTVKIQSKTGQYVRAVHNLCILRTEKECLEEQNGSAKPHPPPTANEESGHAPEGEQQQRADGNRPEEELRRSPRLKAKRVSVLPPIQEE